MRLSARVRRRTILSLALLAAGLLACLGLAHMGMLPGWPPPPPHPTLRVTLGEGEPNSLSCLAFSPDGRTLASGTSRDGKVKLWGVATGENTATLPGVEGPVHCLAFSPEGGTLASGVGGKGGGTAIQLWDRTTGVPRATLQGPGVRSVAFRPDGKVLASGSMDGTIKLWDVASGKDTASLKAWGVVSVAFSPDGRTLASASMDGSVRLWDLASDKNDPEVGWQIGPWGDASSVAFSPDGTAVAAGGATGLMSLGIGSGSIHLWDLVSRQARVSFRVDGQNIESVAFSPDGKLLASGSWDGRVQLWDTSTGRLRDTVWADYHPIPSVVFSPDGKVLAAGSSYGHIKLWDMPNAQEPDE
jgi:WD40 repeat protein